VPTLARASGFHERFSKARDVFWNSRNTGLQGDRVKQAGKFAGRRRPNPPAAVAQPAAVVRPLLAWYGRARRDLPWRRSAEPYRVWVSEVMLQQTQVERVKDFYVRFLDRFPTVSDLAAAAEHDVLRLWEGLGYYRRARQLHAAAKKIVADHAGEFPRTVTALRGLPGIGRYTAGAIASIAFGLPEPIVEANSRRVIARLAGHAGPLGGSAGDEPIWEIVAGIVPKEHPGRFNQALMDLGAMVCTPERPLCGACPLAACCVARRTGRVAEIPVKAARRAVKEMRETAVVVRRAGLMLVVRRGPGEWWEGLWDFPRVPGAARSAQRGIERSEALRGLSCGATSRLGTIAHTVTHHRITLDVVSCAAKRGGRAAPGRRWVTAAAIRSLAMTSPGRRIARLLG
jgi:A/G-specific adenine glycosylase